MKKVLIIAYAFPPSGYVGSLRTLKFCKYLPSFGWRPIILTVNYTSTEYRDEKLLKELPMEAIVYRTLDCDPTKWFNRQNKPKLRKIDLVDGTPTHTHRKPCILSKVKTFLRQLITIPDIHISWVPFGLVRAIQIMMHHKIDVILCSSPPHSSHIIAFLISKLFNRPYVADFRDPWLVTTIKRKRSSCLASIDRYLEKNVFKQASRIVTVSNGLAREMSKIASPTDKTKFVVVNNGFDIKDFDGKAKPGSPNGTQKLIIMHTGTLYKNIADELFVNISKLSNYNDLISNIEITLIGYLPEEYQKTITTTNLRSIVRHCGYKTHSEAVSYMLEADVLLLLLPADQYMDGILPAKLFEYMATGRPILAITTENEAAAIIRKSNVGIIIHPQDATAFMEVILALYNEKKDKGHLSRIPNWDYVMTFERKKLTEKLVRLLENVL